MKKIIAQFDEACSMCDCEIPKGDFCYEREAGEFKRHDVILCRNCGESLEDDIL